MPVKQVELAPAMHQLSLVIKMEMVNICGELIHLSGLSVPFIWVPSLKETRFSSDKWFFRMHVFFIVRMLHMAPLIKKKFLWGHATLPFWQLFLLEVRALCRISLQRNSSSCRGNVSVVQLKNSLLVSFSPTLSSPNWKYDENYSKAQTPSDSCNIALSKHRHR